MSDTTVDATMTPREQQLGSIALGICFAVIMVVSALRMRQTPIAAAAETTVVTAFYSLICATSCLRALYFLLPPIHHTPPVALEKGEDSSWLSTLLAESLVTLGSLTLFSIFILILVYWADILRKYYTPGARRSAPMRTFGLVTGVLAACAAVNVMLCVIGIDSTEGLVLGNAIVLSVTSIICVTEMTIFSRKFQHVLQTLGAINQVSTEAQVQRIVWITVTGNVFFLSRAVVELVLSSLLVLTWWRTGTVQRDLSDFTWDILCCAKYGAEVAILALMLHILQSRFQQSNSSSNATNGIGYQKVPEVATTTETTPSAAGMSV